MPWAWCRTWGMAASRPHCGCQIRGASPISPPGFSSYPPPSQQPPPPQPPQPLTGPQAQGLSSRGAPVVRPVGGPGSCWEGGKLRSRSQAQLWTDLCPATRSHTRILLCPHSQGLRERHQVLQPGHRAEPQQCHLLRQPQPGLPAHRVLWLRAGRRHAGHRAGQEVHQGLLPPGRQQHGPGQVPGRPARL